MTRKEFWKWLREEVRPNLGKNWRKIKPHVIFWAWFGFLFLTGMTCFFVTMVLFLKTGNPWVFLLLLVVLVVYMTARVDLKDYRIHGPDPRRKQVEKFRYKVFCPHCGHDFIIKAKFRMNSEKANDYEVFCPACESEFGPKYVKHFRIKEK